MVEVNKQGRTPLQAATARWNELDREFSSWRGHYAEISEKLNPRSSRFLIEDRNDGRRRHNAIYDSTGTRALRVLGAGLMGGATSPARPWFRLATPDPDLMKYAPVKLWLAHVARAMLDVFQRSNTYRTLHTMYEDLGAFGTSANILMDDFDRVIHNYPLAVGEFRLATDYRGIVNLVARKFQKTVDEVVREFVLQSDGSLDWSNASTALKTAWDSADYNKGITLLHIIEPRQERDVRSKTAKNMPFKSCYFEEGQEEKRYLRESGMKQFRALCPRWQVQSGDVYGHSPGMEALGDIKQLQHEQLRKAEAIDYKVHPPLQIPTAYKSRLIDTLPGGYAFFDATNGSKIQSMFDVNLDIRDLREDIMDVRNRIERTFYTDLFLMLANQQDSRMTATEVAERHEEKLLMLGPVLERLHNELLDPLISMTFSRMLEAGMLPPPPEELQNVDLQVEFVSMLAQAQRAVSTNSVDRFVMNLGAIAQAKPGVLDRFDEDKWVDHYADMLGIDPELIVPDDKVALVRKDRAAQQQAAQAAQTAVAGADVAQKLGNTPTDTSSALTDVMNMFSGYNSPSVTNPRAT